MSDLCKQSVDIITVFGWGLKEIHSVSVCEILPNICRNLVVIPVYLVAHQDPQYFRRCVLLNLPQPVWTAVEGWLVGHIVDQDEGVGRPVVRLGDAPEPGGEERETVRASPEIWLVLPLLARRVPDLQFNLLPVDFDSFNHEVHPDGGALAWREHSLGEPPH